MGGIFNKLALEGFYSLEACKSAVSSYFENYKKSHSVYGFMPLVEGIASQEPTPEVDGPSDAGVGHSMLHSEMKLSGLFSQYVDLPRLLADTWYHNVRKGYLCIKLSTVPAVLFSLIVVFLFHRSCYFRLSLLSSF